MSRWPAEEKRLTQYFQRYTARVRYYPGVDGRGDSRFLNPELSAYPLTRDSQVTQK